MACLESADRAVGLTTEHPVKPPVGPGRSREREPIGHQTLLDEADGVTALADTQRRGVVERTVAPPDPPASRSSSAWQGHRSGGTSPHRWATSRATARLPAKRCSVRTPSTLRKPRGGGATLGRIAHRTAAPTRPGPGVTTGVTRMRNGSNRGMGSTTAEGERVGAAPCPFGHPLQHRTVGDDSLHLSAESLIDQRPDVLDRHGVRVPPGVHDLGGLVQHPRRGSRPSDGLGGRTERCPRVASRGRLATSAVPPAPHRWAARLCILGHARSTFRDCITPTQ